MCISTQVEQLGLPSGNLTKWIPCRRDDGKLVLLNHNSHDACQRRSTVVLSPPFMMKLKPRCLYKPKVTGIHYKEQQWKSHHGTIKQIPTRSTFWAKASRFVKEERYVDQIPSTYLCRETLFWVAVEVASASCTMSFTFAC